jgi:hypothetical protein
LPAQQETRCGSDAALHALPDDAVARLVVDHRSEDGYGRNRLRPCRSGAERNDGAQRMPDQMNRPVVACDQHVDQLHSVISSLIDGHRGRIQAASVSAGIPATLPVDDGELIFQA